MASKPRVKVPKKANAGDVIKIKTLISHKMESGLRKGSDGNLIPQNIINAFSAKFNGKPVFSVTVEPSISANPYFEFNAKVEESGTFEFEWLDDSGARYTTQKDIKVG